MEKIGDIKGVSYSLHQIGMIYQDKGDYDAALKQYEKAKEISEKIGDIKGVSSSLHQIGRIYQERGDYDAALKQYRKSMEIKEKIGDIKGVSSSLHNIGAIYQDKGDYDAALKQYRKSMEIKEKIGDIAGAALSMAQIGTLYFKQNQFESALKLFIQAFLVFTKIGSPYANQARKDIARAREKLPREPFNAILKEFNLTPEVFDKADAAEQQKKFSEFLVGITKDAVSAAEKSSEEKKKLADQLNQFIEQLPDAPEAEGLKNYFQLLLAVVNDEDYQPYLEKVPEELKELFEKF
jgi:tetratricopeptide (TPR) repeat protein